REPRRAMTSVTRVTRATEQSHEHCASVRQRSPKTLHTGAVRRNDVPAPRYSPLWGIPDAMENRMVSSHTTCRGAPPRRRQRGVAAVEFGLVALLFFTVLFSIIDWSYLFFANLSMQHAVREGARYAVVGRSDLAPQDRPGDRCAAVK